MGEERREEQQLPSQCVGCGWSNQCFLFVLQNLLCSTWGLWCSNKVMLIGQFFNSLHLLFFCSDVECILKVGWRETKYVSKQLLLDHSHFRCPEIVSVRKPCSSLSILKFFQSFHPITFADLLQFSALQKQVVVQGRQLHLLDYQSSSLRHLQHSDCHFF